MADDNIEFTNHIMLESHRLALIVERRVKLACLHLEKSLKIRHATGERTGKLYKVPGTLHKFHRSSAPGESPAVLFSRLLNSISHIVKVSKASIVGIVGTNIEYAARLEFGFMDTDSKGRAIHQEPRPLWRVTYEEQRKQIMTILTARIR